MNEMLDTELGEIGTQAGMIETEDLSSEKLTSDKKTIFSLVVGFFRLVFGKE